MEMPNAFFFSIDNAFFWSFCLFLGACLGSFCHLAAERIVEGKSFVLGRSTCPLCGHTLRWLDILPVVNFFLLKGRCHFCRGAINPAYPFVEICYAVVTLLIGMQWGMTVNALMVLVFFSLLFILSEIDLQVMGMPRSLLLATLFSGALCGYKVFHVPPDSMLMGGMSAALLFWGVGRIGRCRLTEEMKQAGIEAIGWGDIWLAGILGVTFGLQPVFGIIGVACILGAWAGFMGMLTKRAPKSDKLVLPFGPFLGAGVFIWLFITSLANR